MFITKCIENDGKSLYREHSAYLLLQFSWATATDEGGKEREG